MKNCVERTKRSSKDRGGLDGRLRQFRDTEDGAILVLFSLMIIPLIIIVGFAMELALTEHLRTKLQGTTDSASLAAADLEQSLDPEDVVNDFFDKAGLSDYLTDVDVINTVGERTVTVIADAQQDALLTKVAGIRAWDIPVTGRATETRGDIEIAVVLDNSGSMSWEPPSAPPGIDSRMELLIPAAEQFVDAVQPRPGEGGTTTISLVPFATQVSVGEDMLGQFTASSEHSASHCVSILDNTDYTTTAISPDAAIDRTAHFDYTTTNGDRDWSLSRTVCPTDSARRDIYPWSESAANLKAKIRAMEPYGNTSIEHATKWAVALLDPSLQPVLSALSEMDAYSYMSGPATRGQPYNYGTPNTFKYLIVMSDGENTSSWDVKGAYRGGPSRVFRPPGTRDYYYYYPERGGVRERHYFRLSDERWYSARADEPRPRRRLPDDVRGTAPLTWPEVWAEMSVQKFAQDIKVPAVGGDWEDTYDDIVRRINNGWKNNRTAEICTAAKDAGITVFTIGMDTYGQGDTTLSNCASSPTLFYDVQSVDIASAFASIAREINKLRLTQ